MGGPPTRVGRAPAAVVCSVGRSPRSDPNRRPSIYKVIRAVRWSWLRLLLLLRMVRGRPSRYGNVRRCCRQRLPSIVL